MKFNLKKIDWDQINSVSKTIKTINYLINKTQYASVDFNGWYNDQFNFKRYFVCLLHMVMLSFCLLIGLYNLYFDSLFYFVESISPKISKSLIITALLLVVLAFIIRLDVFIGEWNRRICVYKYFHLIEDNIESKHGLTKKNYRKLSTLVRLTELFVLKGTIPSIAIFCALLFLYITIISRNIYIMTYSLLVIYGAIIVPSSISISGTIGFVSMYYFKLLFDQINEQIEVISKHEIISLINRFRLIRLTKRHNSIAHSIHITNLMIRRTVCALFIILSFLQIIPLNLFIECDFWFLQIFYLIYLFTTISFGLGVALVFSMQINSAHKSYKTIYKILRRNQKFGFKFEWKVFQ